MTEAVGCLLILLAMPFTFFIQGWVLSILWAWFLVPTFNVPTLSIPMAIGLAMIVGFLTDKGDTLSSEGKEQSKERLLGKVVTSIAHAFVRPIVALVLGWVVLLFI